MPNFSNKVEKWVEDKKRSVSRTATKWTDDVSGLDSAAPRPSVRNPNIAKSKDVNLRTRASHKTDAEILRKLDTAPRKMAQGLGGILGAKASVIARPHHTDSWGAVGTEAGNYGRSFLRGLVYQNEATARGLKSPQQSDAEQWKGIRDEAAYGATRGFFKGLGSPQQKSVAPQTPAYAPYSTPHWITDQPWST